MIMDNSNDAAQKNEWSVQAIKLQQVLVTKGKNICLYCIHDETKALHVYIMQHIGGKHTILKHQT